MNESIGVGITGTGTIADFHARAIELVEGAHLVAVHSRGAEAGTAFAAQHHCDYEAELETLLARPDVRAIAITTPSGTHADIGIQAARAGKHVLCEKPLDVTVEKIDALVAACEQHGVILGAVFQSRFGPGARALKAAFAAGRFGQAAQCSAFVPWYRSEEYYAAVAWRGTWELDGGGALMNQAVHAVDTLLWVAGDVREVSARCQTLLHDSIEVEDNAVAWLQFENGGLGVIQASTSCYPGETKRIEIKGQKGSVTLEDDRPSLWQFEHELPSDAAVRKLADTALIGGGASDPKAISVEGHRAQFEDFTAAIREGREPAVPGREGRKSVALIRGIYESSKTGAVVKL